jgi:hypothetical protein
MYGLIKNPSVRSCLLTVSSARRIVEVALVSLLKDRISGGVESVA